MSATLDLDIRNYSINDLISFFKLQSTYTSKELITNEKTMTIAILNSKDIDENKYNLLNFIRKGKDILMDNLHPETVENKKDKPVIKQDVPEKSPSGPEKANNVGKIINPYSNHPSLQQQSIPYNSVNGYGYNTFVVNYVFNTVFRDDFFNTQSTNCTFTLPMKLKNVINLSLSGIQFPNVMFTFSAVKGTNQIYIKAYPGDKPDSEGLVVIPDGNYSVATFPKIFEDNLNEQIFGLTNPTGDKFIVKIDPDTLYLTISMGEGTFDMYLITNKYGVYYECETNFSTNFKIGDVDPKQQITPETFTNTLGYQIGYRKMVYRGSNQYTTESHFDPTYSDYIYFTLNDFVGSQSSNVYGILPNSLLDKNILAVIPITTPQNSNTFDNNANFIYKTRNYIGPVDIGKITIGLINQYGGQLDLHYTDFAFTLQVQAIYDNNIPYQNNTVSIV
jgi:hypothetical protein